jgi:hypothetical protein
MPWAFPPMQSKLITKLFAMIATQQIDNFVLTLSTWVQPWTVNWVEYLTDWPVFFLCNKTLLQRPVAYGRK